MSPCGRFKVAECSAAYGANATASFIRGRASLLAREIQQARAVWLRTWQLDGCAPEAEFILKRFTQIGYLCTADDVLRYIPAPSDRTPRTAAFEIMQGLFPTYSLDSVARMARATGKRRT